MDNAELGRKVVDIIDTQPELFDMGTWASEAACGTVACLAGHVLLLSGYKFRFDRFWCPDGTLARYEPEEAAKLLGMDEDEQGYHGKEVPVWFDFKNGPDRFRKLVEESEGRQAQRALETRG